MANKDLGRSVTYRKYQQGLLQTGINNKRKSHLSSNDDVLKIQNSIQWKKINKLLTENESNQDPEKAIFQFSKAFLIESEKLLLMKRLSFSLPAK